MKVIIESKNLELLNGDITQQKTDAIVNAANSSLLGGGGVDGAIHRVGGPVILEECKSLEGCSTGEAKITTGGNLFAQYVIHAVGPVWQGGKASEDRLLCSAYLRSLEIADENKLTSIAFPSISTGAYGFPIQKASNSALTTIVTFLSGISNLKRVICVLYSKEDFDVYESTLDDIAKVHKKIQVTASTI